MCNSEIKTKNQPQQMYISLSYQLKLIMRINRHWRVDPIEYYALHVHGYILPNVVSSSQQSNGYFYAMAKVFLSLCVYNFSNVRSIWRLPVIMFYWLECPLILSIHINWWHTVYKLAKMQWMCFTSTITTVRIFHNRTHFLLSHQPETKLNLLIRLAHLPNSNTFRVM